MAKYLVEASYTREGVAGVQAKGGSSRRDAVAEIEQLLLLPFTPEHIDKVNRLTMKIVRAARTGPIVHHAMQLISALHHARVKVEKHSSAVDAALAALQRSIESQRLNSGSPG